MESMKKLTVGMRMDVRNRSISSSSSLVSATATRRDGNDPNQVVVGVQQQTHHRRRIQIHRQHSHSHSHPHPHPHPQSSPYHQCHNHHILHRSFSTGWQGHGTDLLNDSLAHNYGIPKIVLHGHSASGFDIINMVKNMDPNDPELKKTGGIVHLCGSIFVLPGAAFLWNVRTPQQLTVESVCSPLMLYRPQLEYLFIGSPDGAGSIDPIILDQIRQTLLDDQLKEQQEQSSSSTIMSTTAGATTTFSQNLVVEPMDLTNAMGTFNILNGEDRRVGAALILPVDES